MYWMPMRRRRSRATGCWVAMTMKICSRICLKSSLRYWSCERTFSAAGPSRRRSASSEASICASTTVPMRTTDSRSLASSLSNVRRGNWLAEASGDVGLSSRVARRVEQVGAGAEGDVVADRHRERARALEDHAHLLAEVEELRRGHDVGAIQHHRALGARAGHEVVHAVEHPQQRGLAAPRGTDDRGDPFLRDVEGHVLQGACLAIEEGKGIDLELRSRGSRHRSKLRPPYLRPGNDRSSVRHPIPRIRRARLRPGYGSVKDSIGRAIVNTWPPSRAVSVQIRPPRTFTGRSMPSLVTLSCTNAPRSNGAVSTAIVPASMSPSWRRLSMILLSRSASFTSRSANRCRSFGAGSPKRLSAVRRSEVIGVFSSWTRLATNSWRTVARRRSSVTSESNMIVSPARRLDKRLTRTVRRRCTSCASAPASVLPRTSSRPDSSVPSTQPPGKPP